MNLQEYIQKVYDEKKIIVTEDERKEYNRQQELKKLRQELDKYGKDLIPIKDDFCFERPTKTKDGYILETKIEYEGWVKGDIQRLFFDNEDKFYEYAGEDNSLFEDWWSKYVDNYNYEYWRIKTAKNTSCPKGFNKQQRISEICNRIKELESKKYI